jgi:uncharacterized protein (TIGR02265 family)
MSERSSPLPGTGPHRFRCATDAKRIDAPDNWEQLRARIAATPLSAQVRGMFLSELLRSAPEANVEGRRYVAFGLYPVREYMELILRVAQVRPDKSPPATAVLRTGLGVYELFANSLIGTAIFAIAGNFRRVVEGASKAYAVSLPSSQVEVIELSSSTGRVRLRQVWPYPDVFQAGIWLGAMEKMGATGEIEVTRHAFGEVEFDMRWSQA